MTRHMFAGAATPVGFVDFFDYIMPLERAKRRYFLKGASGSGKSTFMKVLAAKLADAGCLTEIFHCANDAQSLDAVGVWDRGLCFLDATLPHSRDPQIPGAIDIIIDFARFIDGEKVSRSLDEIKSLLGQKKMLYDKAMGHFAAVFGAKEPPMDFLEKERKLFLSAITPDGPVSFAEDFFGNCAVQTTSQEQIKKIRSEAASAGLLMESFYSPLRPSRIEYLFLPSEGEVYADEEEIWANHDGIDEIVAQMNFARTCHLKIEKIYVAAMDFRAVDKMTEGIAAEWGKLENID